MDQYAVMGNPIEHSKSPIIHQLFAAQTEQSLVYEKMCVPKDGFIAALNDFQKRGGKGLNITVPFKEQAWQWLDNKSQRAELAGAVNTLIFNQQGCYGENTDGVGLVTDLIKNNNATLKDKKVLVLGAGGAVRGVLGPLLDQHPEKIVVANRTVSKADTLAEMFASLGNVSGCGFDELNDEPFDWVINGTSASLNNQVPPIPSIVIGVESRCYDMMYGNQLTPFNQWAKNNGAKQVIDGLGMLVEQAAESFYLWRGVRPETTPVMKALRSSLPG